MLHKKENKRTFFVDAMLGNIAKKLRLLGYDSKYFSYIDDEKLINIAKKENRIIISKDENLVKKSQKFGIESIFIRKNTEIDQLCEVVRYAGLRISEINGDTARCPKCNSLTVYVDKITVKEKIPRKVRELNERFWKCENCSKIYWEGTHIKNLQKLVGKINEKLQ